MAKDSYRRTMAGNVIQLLTGQTQTADTGCFTEVEAYWTALCAGRLMPYRHEVDPRGIAGALGHVFLIERLAPGVARFRLAGQCLTDAMGMDIRGMPLTTFFTPAARGRLSEALESVFAEPARLELELESHRNGLRGPVKGRMMLLPLRGNNGEVDRAIGCFALDQTATQPVQRFDITDETRKTLVGYANLPEVEATPRSPQLDAEFARADAARERLRHREVMRDRLTLLSSDN